MAWSSQHLYGFRMGIINLDLLCDLSLFIWKITKTTVHITKRYHDASSKLEPSLYPIFSWHQ